MTPDNYKIEERTVYSTQKLEKLTSTETDTMEGWMLTDTVMKDEYGQWSEWSTEVYTTSDTRNVDKETRYRYKTKETSISNSSTKSGWELYDTTYSWGEYGPWSSWSTTKVSKSDSRDMGTKTQYRYCDKEYTTSSSSSLSGWMQYDSETTYGNWSGWSTKEVSSSDTRQVEQLAFQSGQNTLWPTTARAMSPAWNSAPVRPTAPQANCSTRTASIINSAGSTP